MADQLTTVSSLGTASATAGVAARVGYYYDKIRLFSGLIGPQMNIQVPDGMTAIKVNQIDYLTFGAITEGTAKDSETFTTVGRTLTPAMHGTNIVESILAAHTTALDRDEMYAEAAGAAWAIQEDSVATYSFAAQYDDTNTGGTTHVVGANGTAMTAAQIRQAAALIAGDGGRRPYNLVIDPIQTEELFRDTDAKSYMYNTNVQAPNFAATVGVSPDRYLGRIFGVHVWEGNGMIESTGLYAIMFAQGALAKGYRVLRGQNGQSTGEMLVDRYWDGKLLSHRITFAVCQHIDGAVFTAGTNVHMANIVT
jgi:hypothetical protein